MKQTVPVAKAGSLSRFSEGGNMRSNLSLAALLALALSLMGCASEYTAEKKTPEGAAKGSRPSAAAKVPAAPKTVTIPAGTKLVISLVDSVSTDKSRSGDRFGATLNESIVIDGETVVGKGADVQGRVVEVDDGGRVKGRAYIRLALTELVTKGKNIPIDTKLFGAQAAGSKKKDAAIIGGGAGIGAAIGAIAGGGKGAAIGAAIGGGSGTGVVMATKGKQIRYPSETRLTFTLEKPVEVPK